MTLEHHPMMHTLLILLCYNIGQFAGIMAMAYAAAKSQLNSLSSIRGYFRLRWVPITVRWVICLFMFFVAWDNPSVMNLEKFMPSLLSHLGVAGFLGFASDQIWDKILVVVLPGIQKELPAIPAVDDNK